MCKQVTKFPSMHTTGWDSLLLEWFFSFRIQELSEPKRSLNLVMCWAHKSDFRIHDLFTSHSWPLRTNPAVFLSWEFSISWERFHHSYILDVSGIDYAQFAHTCVYLRWVSSEYGGHLNTNYYNIAFARLFLFYFALLCFCFLTTHRVLELVYQVSG